MELAALILSIIALMMGAASLIWQLAIKLSTHTVQLQPVESLFNPAMGKKIGSEFKEIGDPLDDLEQKYFEEQNKPKGGP